MSISVLPGATFDALLNDAAGAGALTVGIYDTPADVAVYGPSSAGIVEAPAGSGLYAVTLTAPATEGYYSIVWTDGTVTAREDLVVGVPGHSVRLDKAVYSKSSRSTLTAVQGRTLYVLERNGPLSRAVDLNAETLVEGFSDEGLTVSLGFGPFASNSDGQFDVWVAAGFYDLYTPADRTNPITRWQPIASGVPAQVSQLSADVAAMETDVSVLQADVVEAVAFSDRLPPALTNSDVPGNGIDGADAALEALAPGTYSALATDKFRIEGDCRIPALVNIVGAGQTDTVGTGGTIFECVNADSALVFDIGYGGVSGGFVVDGMGVAMNPMKLYITVGRTFENFKVRRSAGNGLVLEGAQNNTLRRFHSEDTIGAGLVLDLGCGQNYFHDYEINDFGSYGIISRQSGASPPEASTVEYPINNSFHGGIVEYLKASALGSVYQSAGSNMRFDGNANFPMAEASAIERAIFTLENDATPHVNGQIIIDGITAGGQVAGTSNFIRVKSTSTTYAFVITGYNYVANFLNGVKYSAGQYPLHFVGTEPDFVSVTNRWVHLDNLPDYGGGYPEYALRRPRAQVQTFLPVDPDDVSNNSIFLDATDNVLKQKNNSGVSSAL